MTNNLQGFRDQIAKEGIDALRDGLIGKGAPFETPFGTQRILYADYIASGRALRQVEDFIAENVLPYYANSHTEASFCGRMMTQMRAEARETIARLTNCTSDCSVIFTGSGATAGLNRIVGLLNIRERVLNGEHVAVIIGPYEHHSNILPWRESGAEVLEMGEADRGGIDLGELERKLQSLADRDLVIGSFSAASNVTGIITDPDPVCCLLKRCGALSVWDYAGGGPYLPMDLNPAADCRKDAVVFSPHKFPGGPGASGVMIIRDSVVQRQTPTAPGGGTVDFVSSWRHTYFDDVTLREEGGTPDVIGDIRAALAMLVKDAIGTAYIHERDEALRERLLQAWKHAHEIRLLGQVPGAEALPFFSFVVLDGDGQPISPRLFTRMLSDRLGIQARGGCSCAGPYGHRLLGIDEAESDRYFRLLQNGKLREKPGWVRFNLSYLHTDEEVETIITQIPVLAKMAAELQKDCDAEMTSGFATPGRTRSSSFGNPPPPHQSNATADH